MTLTCLFIYLFIYLFTYLVCVVLHSKQWRLHSFDVQSCPALRFRFVILSSRIAVDLKIESPSNSMHLNGVGKGHKLNEFKSKSHSQKVISNWHQNHHHVRVTSVGRSALHRQQSPAAVSHAASAESRVVSVPNHITATRHDLSRTCLRHGRPSRHVKMVNFPATSPRGHEVGRQVRNKSVTSWRQVSDFPVSCPPRGSYGEVAVM